jgi:hypothetical protein
MSSGWGEVGGAWLLVAEKGAVDDVGEASLQGAYGLKLGVAAGCGGVRETRGRRGGGGPGQWQCGARAPLTARPRKPRPPRRRPAAGRGHGEAAPANVDSAIPAAAAATKAALMRVIPGTTPPRPARRPGQRPGCTRRARSRCRSSAVSARRAQPAPPASRRGCASGIGSSPASRSGSPWRPGLLAGARRLVTSCASPRRAAATARDTRIASLAITHRLRPENPGMTHLAPPTSSATQSPTSCVTRVGLLIWQ